MKEEIYWGNLFALFLFLGEEDEDTKAIRALRLSFEVPRNFMNPDKFRPEQSFDDQFATVPDLITTSVFEAMDVNVPIDPLNPFIYLRSQRLPEFVVVYFMELVPRRVKSNMSRFFTAMHLIEMYREYVIIPPHHFMAVDTAAGVASEAVEQGNSQGTEDKDDKKEDKEEEQKKDDVGASTSNG